MVAKVLGCDPFDDRVLGLTEAQQVWILEQAYLDLPASVRAQDDLEKQMRRVWEKEFGTPMEPAQ